MTAVDDDPFAAPIEDVGVPIRLDGDQAELAAELVRLVRAERGREPCPIRALPDTCCNACPVAGRYGRLCAGARRQEEIVTLLAVREVDA